MIRTGLVFLFAASPFLALAQDVSPAEQESLTQALQEAGNSSIDFLRALENHLKMFPNSPKRPDLERALIKTAIDLNDDRRISQFGESVLKREPDNLQVLERVTTALLHNGDKVSAERALEHAQHFQQVVTDLYKNDKFVAGAGREAAKRKEDYDRGQARALLLLARPHGLLGHNTEAIKLAESSYKIFPSVEAAREAARWLSAAGQDKEALQYLANAFTIAGLRSADPDGPNDRARMAEIYRKLNGSEAGLGDVILKAYDGTAAQLATRRTLLRDLDPNAQIKDPLAFTLSGLDGGKLPLSSLLGKVIVLDFWATWCVPCRQQHPLYDQVKARYKDTGDVVFLSVDTDEDHSLVKPFLESQKWTQKVYFEDGLSSLLQVSSIPMTLVYNKKGDIVSRMAGFVQERFVDMLSDRIDEALGKPREPQKPKAALSQ
jgi:thiol-disulfide isomerase/thioredoxin